MSRMTLAVKSLAVAALIALAAAPAGANVHQMFVTSEVGSGKLSTWPEAAGKTGRAAGDQICQTLAANAGLANAANFVAWLSTTNTDAFCHVAGFGGKRSADCGQASLPNAGPWQRVDGKPFAYKLQKMLGDRSTLYPAMLDERGNPLPFEDIHTGTLYDGTLELIGTTEYDCGNWTSEDAADLNAIGNPMEGSSFFTNLFWRDCSQHGHLLCMEKGIGDKLPAFAHPGAYVFVTSESGTGNLASWPHAQGTGKTGVAAGDAICQGLATDAGFANPGSFLAYLSVDGAPAPDRLPIDGPWRRPGGVEVAATKADLTGAAGEWDPELEADVQVDDKGVHAVTPYAYTGTGFDGTWSGNDCAGWTSADAADTGSFGDRVSAAGFWTTGGLDRCDQQLSLYCFSSIVSDFDDGFEGGDLSAWDGTAP